ncbi:hypothetical protein BDV19DRAFT_386403 [Aspergillus venezuelensis]
MAGNGVVAYTRIQESMARRDAQQRYNSRQPRCPLSAPVHAANPAVTQPTQAPQISAALQTLDNAQTAAQNPAAMNNSRPESTVSSATSTTMAAASEQDEKMSDFDTDPNAPGSEDEHNKDVNKDKEMIDSGDHDEEMVHSSDEGSDEE